MHTTRLITRADNRLRAALLNLERHGESGYWEFRRQSKRSGVHGLFQYPAMMVPKMQGDILDAILLTNPDTQQVWDPFVGAGTTLTETMARGCNFSGLDINPLAILICEAKSSVFLSADLDAKAQSVLRRCLSDTGMTIDAVFPGRTKWFTRRVAIRLSRIRRAIQQESSDWVRKIMWVVFAETIRKTSNSRTSTYKLHIRPLDDVVGLPDPIKVFKKELLEAVERFRYHEELLGSKNLLISGKYRAKTDLRCQDIRTDLDNKPKRMFDLMITSPPYGDNRSTVSYGQFSYLALNWIPVEDLPAAAEMFSSAYATDVSSLGGRMIDTDKKAAVVNSVSPAFREYYRTLTKLGDRRLNGKVASFLYDFFEAMNRIVPRIKPGGYLAWTLGDRTVGGTPVPFVKICREFQESLGLSHVVSVRRKIPSKRTPGRNSVGNTMGSECLVLTRRN